MKIHGELTLTNFESRAFVDEPFAICPSCRGRIYPVRDELGRCEKCGQEYELSYIAMVKPTEEAD